ncbi:type I restriction endonuclease subunit R [Candidatus Synechococcus spongiarum]|uniref:type I restriction endonuclease subunit R n=1 Tax=Candidatus Synechococcus spongiarum TaxID=431041 RepID=UPI00047052A3|nr:type I restriction endonuclease subunit R [Candidatus Synechococcus spongiarum]
MTTDVSERGLERLICQALTGDPCDPPAGPTSGAPAAAPGGCGWSPGNRYDYNREHCLDIVQLRTFLHATQPDAAPALRLEEDGPTRRKFLARLHEEIAKHGVVTVLRNGIRHGAHHLELFYVTPSLHNDTARRRFQQNRFTVTRQLRYSRDETQRALDMVLCINGLPVFTFELKNSLTRQTFEDAVEQYKRDRNPHEPLFRLGRCVAHFAVDDHQVQFCTHLQGKASRFLPFNRGWQQGAGNPPNPDGLKTDYLWRRVLTRQSVANILENYTQLVAAKDGKTGRTKKVQIWPRYHQLEVVRRLLEDACRHGAGRRYLIQHSAGSGKSYSIAWLAHQLIGLERDSWPVFDSVVVVTDRRILDQQIRDTIRQYTQVRATVAHAEHSGDLRRFIEQGKKIIISTVQKFPVIVEEIGNPQRGRNFAVIIDEAHSSQGGKASAAMSRTLGETGDPEEAETDEDRINRLMASRKLLPNASYYAFTATPKNRTLEIFGDPEPQGDGAVRHRPFHVYSMKQAIQEGFILDVLQHYTPVSSYYKLAKTVEEDPEFDAGKAHKKLRRYVEGHQYAVRHKAEIMVEHFHEQVIAQRKIGGKARAMVVTSGIERAIQYFHAVRDILKQRKSPYRAVVAFSGEHGDEKLTEATLNGFPAARIAEVFQEEPYRFLVCADKFQTGYDEPLLHTMYVDKPLSGVKAVQTLSRLNRAHAGKHDVFVLDFQNDTETIKAAFSDYYRTTILSDATDPDKLHDLQAHLDHAQVYGPDQVEACVRRYLDGAERDQLDPILNRCVAVYRSDLDEDAQVAFKSKAKAFVRTYAFLSSILPYNNRGWEECSIFLNLLIPKLPAPVEEDLSKGILETVDMDSYRAEKRAMQAILLKDEDGEIDPAPGEDSGGQREAELDLLSRIIANFNDLFGGIPWADKDRVEKTITEEIPARAGNDPAFRNARAHSDRDNARVEYTAAVKRVIMGMMKDHTQFFKHFMDNPDFKRFVINASFDVAYRRKKSHSPESGNP